MSAEPVEPADRRADRPAGAGAGERPRPRRHDRGADRDARRRPRRGGPAARRSGEGRRRRGGAATAQRALDAERALTARAAAQVEILNQQIAALRRQLAAIEDTLGASEQKDRESQARIADLGARLNVALAQRVQELTRYRSDFFGRLRNVLQSRPEFRIVGDRFVIQSEILFDPGQAQLNPAGLPELDKLAQALLDVAREIPPDIAWVLRVDGHTDSRPIRTLQFPSNWELSTARAIAVVRYLATRGIPENRLLAAGFAEFSRWSLAMRTMSAAATAGSSSS